MYLVCSQAIFLATQVWAAALRREREQASEDKAEGEQSCSFHQQGHLSPDFTNYETTVWEQPIQKA